MKMQVYSIYDLLARCYSQPIFCANADVATRLTSIWVTDPTCYLAKSPRDYVLFHIGEFDDESGELIKGTPKQLMQLDQFVAKMQQTN